MLLPYALESLSLRKIPYVTAGIIGTCVLIHVAVSMATTGAEDGPVAEQAAVVEYALEHPHLRLPPDDEEELFAALPKSTADQLRTARATAERLRTDPAFRDAAFERARSAEPALAAALEHAMADSSKGYGAVRKQTFEEILSPVPNEAELAYHMQSLGLLGEGSEQAELDRRIAAKAARIHQDPRYRFGYVPGHPRFLGLLAHMFLHGGWLHLAGNLLFLWLVGFSMEDRWGRAFFALFYVTGGVVAALVQGVFTPSRMALEPLIGASGAISATMGAFLVHFAKTRMRVFWFYMAFVTPRFGSFLAPAYVVLPIWLFDQVFMLWLYAGHTNVAHAAHVGGFLFGVAAALALKATKLEEKFLSGRIDREDVVFEQKESPDGQTFLDEERFEEAEQAALALLSREPKNCDALRVLISARIALGQSEQAAEPFLQLATTLGERKKIDALKALMETLGRAVPRRGWPALRGLRLAAQLKALGLGWEALEEYEQVIRNHGIGKETLKGVILYADLLQELGQNRLAVAALKRVATFAEDPVWSERIAASLVKATVAAEAGPDTVRPAPPPPPAAAQPAAANIPPSPAQGTAADFSPEDLASLPDELP